MIYVWVAIRIALTWEVVVHGQISTDGLWHLFYFLSFWMSFIFFLTYNLNFLVHGHISLVWTQDWMILGFSFLFFYILNVFSLSSKAQINDQGFDAKVFNSHMYHFLEDKWWRLSRHSFGGLVKFVVIRKVA